MVLKVVIEVLDVVLQVLGGRELGGVESFLAIASEQVVACI